MTNTPRGGHRRRGGRDDGRPGGPADGAQVTLVEPNEKLGRKLYITGKGRCNLTNNTTPQGVLDHVPRNGRFLYSAVTRFPRRR